MPKEITQEEAYDKCTADGNFIFNLEADLERAKSMLEIAKEELEAARSLAQKKFWNSTYKMHYEVLHLLVETFLLCDKVMKVRESVSPRPKGRGLKRDAFLSPHFVT